MAAVPTNPTSKKNAPKDWRKRFLTSLAKHGVISAACNDANVTRCHAYDVKSREPEFAVAWEEALEVATDAMVIEARRRAVHGTEKPVFYQGDECGRVREYSDNLLMFLIKKERPEYRDTRPEDRKDPGETKPRIEPRRLHGRSRPLTADRGPTDRGD